jgi:3-oxoacyl-(acyl-carrier-protein) synthase
MPGLVAAGAGVATTVLGAILAGMAQTEGSNILAKMETLSGYAEHLSELERLQRQQRAGFALMGGGGAAVVVGVVTIPLGLRVSPAGNSR